MAIKNGALQIPSFDATGNPGEYSITGALINSLTCPNGTVDIQVGWVLWATAVEVNTGVPIPGTAHRYRIESITPSPDGQTCDMLVMWDEPGAEVDMPLNSSWVAFSEVTPNLQYGLPPSDLIYADLPLGMTTAAMLSNANISDVQTGDKNFVFNQPTPSATWVIDHHLGKQPSVFIEDEDGNDVDASVELPVGMETSRVIITFLEPIAGKATLN